MNTHFAPSFLRDNVPIVKTSAMSYPQEKVFLSVGNLIAAGIAWTGAIMSTGDIRWLLITLCSSFLMSTMLAVIFKKENEKIQLVAARCGISIFGGVCLTKYVVIKMSMDIVHTDPIALAGVSALVTAIMFTVGFACLLYLQNRSTFFAKRFIDSKVGVIIPPSDDSK